ncbi:MAG: RNA polymerase sigma factor [Candidatus Krumholzibacteriia bacterium]
MEHRLPFHELEDDELVVATAQGEARALRVLVERWSPRVLAFLARALGSRSDAEDLAQETFLRLYRAAPRYRAEGRFSAWLFRIAGNLARQEIRKRKVRGFFLGGRQPDEQELLDSLPAPRHFDAAGPLHDAETRAALSRAIARLPERQRLAVLLRYFEEMRVRDIAEVLGTSVHAAESLLARGTRRLRRELRAQIPDL